MRETFVKVLTELAEKDPNVILIVGDVGFNFIEEYAQKFPKQFLNCGAMEQTMIGVAAGMARSGMKPYVYSMINFLLFRPYEQVRNDICYDNMNVKLFGVKGSEAYKFLGHTHNIVDGEDFSVLQDLPNIQMHSPTTKEVLRAIMLEEYEMESPSYTIL